jgi:uncharacterized coiled-coil protein SlyX
MAEEPIRKEDIIDIEGIIAGLQQIIDMLKNDLVAALNAVKKANPTTTEGQQTIKNVSDDITTLAPQLKAISELSNEVIRRQEELARATNKPNKELAAEAKALVSAQRAMDGLSKKTDTYADGSLTDLEKQLAKLRKEWKNFGSASGASTKDIEKLDAQVKKLNASIGNHQKNVGNYKSAIQGVGGSIMEAGKQLGIFGGVAAIATGVLGKLKEAFLGTEVGTKVVNTWKTAAKTFFLSVIRLESPTKVFSNIAASLNASRMQEEVRKGERIDLVKVAELETAIKIARYKSADATLSETEQLQNLNKAIKLEDELIRYNLEDKQDELIAIRAEMIARPKVTELLELEAQKLAEIASIQGDRNLRLLGRASALKEKEEKKRLAALEKEKEAIMFKDLTEIEGIKTVSIEKKNLNDINVKVSEDNIKINEEIAATNQRTATAEEELHQKKLENVRQYLELASQAINVIADLIESSKQRELSAVGDNAKAREKIEKEYFKKQKAIAISQAIINGALGITSSLTGPPIYKWIEVALVSVATAAQIAIISAQKFAEGGEIKGKPHTQGGKIIEAEGGEYVVKKQSTAKYKSLIEAINDDNPMRIAEEIRNRNFHTVWGGVSAQLSQVSKQDPYTRMMYELMKNDIKTYIDSNGDTVLSYPDGSKRVIRKYTA